MAFGTIRTNKLPNKVLAQKFNKSRHQSDRYDNAQENSEKDHKGWVFNKGNHN
jgi:hypothetical protein